MRVGLDVETFSEVDLTKAGARRYAEHSSTELLCMAYCIDDSPLILLWLPGMPWPACIDEAAELWAWNASFECVVLEHVRPGIPRSKWRCSMSLALSYGFPGSLDMAAAALRLPRKDPDGQRAMRRLSQPRKPTKADDSIRFTPARHPELFRRLYTYCVGDVAMERGVLAKLPSQTFTPVELATYQVDLNANAHGMAIDLPTVTAIKGQIVTYGTRLAAEARTLTGGIGVSQIAALGAWCVAQGVRMPDMKGQTIVDTLKRDDLPADVRRVLHIRSSLSQSSTAKYDAMLASVCRDGRIKGLIQYMGAGRTGRWAGRLVQLQNLPRGMLGKGGPWWTENCIDADALDVLGDPMEFYASMIRSCIVASPGKELAAADYSGIEARIVVWAAGEEAGIQEFRDGVDRYCIQASDVFGFNVTKADEFERYIGKKLVLGAGYGLGPGRFLESCAEEGVTVTTELSETAIASYRARNACVVKFWYALDRAVRQALKTPGQIVKCRAFAFRAANEWLQLRLPSGRLLSYYQPCIDRNGDIQYMGVNQRTRDWGPQKLYGGKILQHIGEGVARDIMRDAILRLDQEGPYQYCVSIHDEIVTEVDEGVGQMDDFLQRITILPSWAAGLPLKAEGWIGKRYRKG